MEQRSSWISRKLLGKELFAKGRYTTSTSISKRVEAPKETYNSREGLEDS
jgi:hypothetical protein